MSDSALNHILFVDDDKDIMTIAKYCFDEQSSIQVSYASSGQEAIEKAISQPPDLIILDVMMPGMDGIEVLHLLRSIQKLSIVPVIFLTAKAQKQELEEYLRLGALDVIIKPFDPLTLVDVILSCWKKHCKKNQSL